MKKKVVIIGGGASGFFCAANVDHTRYDVIILEQGNEVLQKVKISGGGRCNVTHACFVPRELTQYYPRGSKELLSVFSKFQPGDTIDWFEKRNVSLKIEADNRIFPQSNSSQSIINALLHEVEEKKFQIKTKNVVLEIKNHENSFLVSTNQEEILADFIVFSTGSAPKSLKILEILGHRIISPVPSLFTFNIKNDFLKDLAGTSFKNATISIPKLKTEETADLLITHWGISGPSVLKISAWKARELFDFNYKFEILLNFLDVDKKEAEDVFKNFKEENPKKLIGSSKIFEITNRFWHRILWLSKIDLDKSVSNISNAEIKKMIENLCENKMKVSGKSTNKEEFVTAGGVDLKEINFKNMSSKILPNFFISGEVLNIDAVTGGFNFQACWSEGWLIAEYLNKL